MCESYHFSGFESCIEFILLIVIEERKSFTSICSYFLHVTDCFVYLRQMNRSPRRDFPPKIEQQKTESVTGKLAPVLKDYIWFLLTVREGRTRISLAKGGPSRVKVT